MNDDRQKMAKRHDAIPVPGRWNHQEWGQRLRTIQKPVSEGRTKSDISCICNSLFFNLSSEVRINTNNCTDALVVNVNGPFAVGDIKNIKESFMKQITLFFVSTLMLFASISYAEEREGRKNFVVVLKGTAAAVPRNFDGVDYLCFDVDLINPAIGQIIGPATDCLEPGSIVPIGDDGGFGINNLTFFGLPGGTVASLSRTSIQPVEDPSQGPTHITGEVALDNNVLSHLSTGRFENATGNTRLSGQVDMSLFGDGIITFDCIFVIDID